MHAGTGGYFRAPVPFQLGRESSGVIAGLGGGVTDWKEGDDAITRNITPCGNCDNCRRDLPEACREPRYQGVSAWGGYADYITVPARSLLRKPPEVGHDQAASFQGGTLTAWHNLITRGRLLGNYSHSFSQRRRSQRGGTGCPLCRFPYHSHY